MCVCVCGERALTLTLSRLSFPLTEDILCQSLLGPYSGRGGQRVSQDGATRNAVGHGPGVGRGPHHPHRHRHPTL